MRNGQLLAEESPAQLMFKHNCSNLEQAFLELSKKQYTSTVGQEDENCVSCAFVIKREFVLPCDRQLVKISAVRCPLHQATRIGKMKVYVADWLKK